jgi:hypothetical protein
MRMLGAGRRPRSTAREHYHADSGTKFLKVNSECVWTVNVIRP